MNNKSQAECGFTLIEILVAMLILLTTISAVSMVYRTSVNSSLSASKNLVISANLSSIINSIKFQLRSESGEQDKYQGEGKYWKVDYYWIANQGKFEAAPEHFVNEEFVQPEPRFKLWDVSLTLVYRGTSTQYQYKEVSWSNEG